MKKSAFWIGTIFSMASLPCVGCKGNEAGAKTETVKMAENMAAVENFASEDNFEWDGNTIVGLSEQGAKQTSIVIPARCEGFNGMIFADKENFVTEVIFESDKNIALGGVFGSTKKIKKIVLPANLERIASMDFWLCAALESIKIPATVVSIEEYAFQENRALSQVEFDGNVVKEIGAHAFDGCDQLSQIDLPDSISIIGEYAFYQCEALETVKLPKSLTQIGGFAYANSGLKNLSIPGETQLSAYEPTSFAQADHSIDAYVTKGGWADINFDKVFSGAFEKKYP